jgi:Putative capsular polysaccharide synthesis protein
MSAPIVVYQMGNVGSSAIFNMLTRAAGVTNPVFHVHTLRDDGIGRNIVDNADWEEKRHIGDSIKVRRLLSSTPLTGDFPAEKKWKWITPVREPIARNLSAFFQNHDRYIPDMLGRWKRGELNVAEIRDAFIQLYDHTKPLRWFDEEYKALFSLDVFDVPFDHAEGYLAIQTNVFDILLLRSEDLDTMSTELFGEFVGANGLVVNRTLEGSKRPYADVYKAFMEEARFPKQYVDALYDTPYTKLFYSPEQVDGFKQKYVE